MATKVLVNGKFKTLPGIYSSIVSGIKNPTVSVPAGNILIIDDGIGAGFGGGSGINGSIKNGADAVYEFNSLQDFQAFVKGGPIWNLATPLFKPTRIAIGGPTGVSKVYYIQARTTIPAAITLGLANGSFTIQPLDEGLNANGVLDSSQNLSTGYAAKLVRTNIPTNNATFITATTQAPAAAVAGSKATATATFSAVGTDGDIYNVEEVNGSTVTELGTYTKTSAETTVTQMATAAAAGVTISGYTATSAAGVVTVSSPIGTIYNGRSVRLTKNGATVITINVLSGGVNASAGLPKISKATALNINVGDVFTAVVSGVTKTVTAASTLPADLYNVFAPLLNGNSTVSAAATVTATPTGLVFTGTTVNVTFTQTSSVTPAPAKFIFQIYHGTYKGLDSVNNVPFDNILSADTKPLLVIQSPVVTSLADLITWFQVNPDFNVGFKLDDGSTATGDIVVGDLTTYPGYVLATGGDESYNVADFDSVLDVINNLDYTHILAMQYGPNATEVNNTKLFTFVTENSKYDRLLVVAGGYDKSTFAIVGTGSSVTTAAYYNCDRVIVIHGGVKKVSRTGFNVYSQLYKAAVILGRVAGLPSQDPVTLKSIAIDGEVHKLGDSEQEFAIANGIMYSYYDDDFKAYVAGLDINTLLKNDFLVNEDSTTYNWALKRIEAELNKGIAVAGKLRFFGDNAGGNRNTTSPEEVVIWAKGYLADRTVSDGKDNLIIKALNVAASISQDNLNLTYDFVGNTEISKIVSTGTLIDG